MFSYAKKTLISVICSSLLISCGGEGGGSQDDQNKIYYANEDISGDEALALFEADGRIFNDVNPAVISDDLKDWQLLDLTAYVIQIYDLSQQAHNIAIENYETDLSDEKALLNNIITARVTGFTDVQFEQVSSIQELCDANQEETSTPFNTEIYESYNTADATTRNAKVRFNMELSQCHYYYTEDEIQREQIAFGDLTYDTFIFENEINTDLTETTKSFTFSMHGKWTVMSNTMGYNDSLGYWFIENFNSNSEYNNSESVDQIETINLRTDLYLRDGFRNFDSRYYIKQQDDSIIYTHLGAENPHSGTVEVSTDVDGELKVIFSEESVDIYVNDDLRLEDVSWADIRDRKLDMTFDYAND